MFELDFDICAVVIYLLVMFILFTKKNSHNASSLLLFAMAIDGFFASIFDIASGVMMNNLSAYPLEIVDTANYFYLIVHNIQPALFFAYLISLTGLYKKAGKSYFILILLPVSISVCLIALNPLTHLVFYYHPVKGYCHGPLMRILCGIAIFYMTLSFIYISRYKESIPHKRSRSLCLFLLGSLISLVVQSFAQRFLIELFSQAMLLLFLMLSLGNEDEIFSITTGSYNRRMFISTCRNYLKIKLRSTLIIIKLINRQYILSVLGAGLVDVILADIVKFLFLVTGDRETVFDCENERFAVLLDWPQEETDRVFNAITKKFSSEWLYEDINVPLRVQIFRVELPSEVCTLESILLILDSESEGVLAGTEQRMSLFLRKDVTGLLQTRKIENAVQDALIRNSLKVYYQPIWDCKNNKIHSAEALIRLHDEEFGWISPEQFIPIAEKNGMVTMIGQFVFEEACALYAHEKMHEKGLDFIEVNLSAVQCMHRNLPRIFRNSIDQYNLSPGTINLEITESAAINSVEIFNDTIKQLKAFGFTFSLDDYGTAHSEATYIFNMDFKIIKIDKSILWGAEKNQSARLFFEYTVKMLKKMNLKILVEGVETEKQKDYVVSLGCDYCQGFYFSRPIPPMDFVKYVTEFNGKE